MSLERPSKRGLGKTSAALNKASIVSIAKQSRFGDASVIASGEEPWHACEAADVLDDLATSATDGLAAPEAARRLQEFGANALTPAKRKGFLAKLWAQLNSTVIYILLAAAIIEGAFQAWAECGLVLAVIVINTAIGLFQEGRAEKAADAIKAMLSPTAKVLRDGQLVTIPAEELVPGDIVTLKSGDKVPADLRLLSASNLQVQEAMLTGESVPTSKITHPVPAGAPLGDRKNLAFSATTVVSGTAEGVVVGTGDSAEIGQINKMVSTVEEAHNNLTHQLTIFGRWLAVLVGVVALVSFLLALLRAGEGLQRAFETAVSISVAIIPEGLPAIVTIVLAIGTTVMARNNAIIRQLPAVETLGSVNVICSDKTGTLTRNEMTVVAVRTAASLYRVSGVGYAPVGSFTLAFSPTPAPVGRPGSRAPAAAAPGGTPATEGDLQVVIEGAPSGGGAGAAQEAAQEAAAAAGAPLDAAGMAVLRALLEGAVLCNDSALSRAEKEGGGSVVYTPMGAPTEVALLTAGEKAGLEQSVLKASKPRLASVPFESEHKFMATVHNEGGARVMYVKGAPDRLLPLCRAQVADNDVSVTSPLDIGLWQQAQADLSNQGLRVLALC
ncbi:ATPase, P-type (transporting), HAD superfamily, subfamily IC, partial [Monoraphidium neglectum]